MPDTRHAGPGIAALSPALADGAGDINGGCHGNLDGVQSNDRVILAHVRVMVVLWGQYYVDTPDAATNAFALCRDLVEGPYLNGLAQYGVGRGRMAGSANLNFTPPPATLSRDDAEKTLLDWLRGPASVLAPAVDEDALLYVLFLPPETKPTMESGDDGFCGYHHWAKLHDESRDSDVFFALIRTDATTAEERKSGAAFIQSVSYCVSHEIAEALTSRDGRGYFNGPCEIGDLCEQTGTHAYRGWQVEQYWSQDDTKCVNGDEPISLRRFLKRRGIAGGSLVALRAPIIDVEFVAAQSR
jgi:hypothetical protein